MPAANPLWTSALPSQPADARSRNYASQSLGLPPHLVTPVTDAHNPFAPGLCMLEATVAPVALTISLPESVLAKTPSVARAADTGFPLPAPFVIVATALNPCSQ
jgi:hypothetical protein